MLQSLVILAAGLNLYLPFTAATITADTAVRWREMCSLVMIIPLSTLLLFLAQWTVERGRHDTAGPFCLMVLGLCWLGISMGVHEPINALWATGAVRADLHATGPALGTVLQFWDDLFSHVIFFAGYVAVSMALLWSQRRNALEAPMRKGVATLFLLCAIPGGAGIYYSLAGTRNSVDMTIIVGVLVVAELMRRGKSFRQRPLNILLEAGYLLAFVLLLLNR